MKAICQVRRNERKKRGGEDPEGRKGRGVKTKWGRREKEGGEKNQVGGQRRAERWGKKEGRKGREKSRAQSKVMSKTPAQPHTLPRPEKLVATK